MWRNDILRASVPGKGGLTASRVTLWALLSLGATVSLAVSPGPADAQDGEAGAECAEGIVSSITYDRRPVFDPSSTSISPLAWTYRTLNLFHVRTARSFIRRELLFAEGDCYDPFLASESERLLDQYGFLSQASVTAYDDGRGGKQVVVSTRDEWSTKVDLGLTYDAGPNIERLQVTEENFLGHGVFAEYTYRERREHEIQSFGLATPRLFGRTDASIAGGRTRPGTFFSQYVRYPFVGETGQYSLRQGYDRGTDFFSYSTDGDRPYTQLLVPQFRELIELSAGRRFGEAGRSVIAGVTLTRDVVRFPGSPQVAFATDFEELQPLPDPLPPEITRQLLPSATTRVALQLGMRRFRYEEYAGLDGVRDRQIVSLGVFAGLTLGRGFDVLLPGDVDGRSDSFGRAYTSFAFPFGGSLVHGSATAEGRRGRGAWRDVLIDADMVAYLRSPRASAHTVFLRASAGGGWGTTIPYQLSLGGREAVRALDEDRFPGGRMVRFVIEDRLVFPWPAEEADLGLTVFSDVGRVWPGDAPFGVDSGWQAGVGFGLRIGLPSETRNIWRADIVFPVGGTHGSPIFRVTYELNKLRSGFLTPDVLRSRRLNLGPDHF
jgi:hypothetical protein